jgi:hypothetical protein
MPAVMVVMSPLGMVLMTVPAMMIPVVLMAMTAAVTSVRPGRTGKQKCRSDEHAPE